MIQTRPKSAPCVHGRPGAACNIGPVQKSVDTLRAQHMSSRQRTICRFQQSQRSTTDASSSAPVKLAKEEMQSLQAVLKANNIPSDTAGASAVAVDQVPDSVVKQMMSVINKGREKEVKDLQQLEGFMLPAEQLQQLQQQPGVAFRKLVPSANPGKVDVWQPIFASAGGFPRLLYIPVPEYFDMHRPLPDATAASHSGASSTDIRPYTPGSINIITELGPFTTHFLGTCKWLRDDAFSYAINKIRIDFAGRSFTIPMFFKLENELDFFLVTDDLACARSKLGGTMLLEANPSKGKQYFDTW